MQGLQPPQSDLPTDFDKVESGQGVLSLLCKPRYVIEVYVLASLMLSIIISIVPSDVWRLGLGIASAAAFTRVALMVLVMTAGIKMLVDLQQAFVDGKKKDFLKNHHLYYFIWFG